MEDKVRIPIKTIKNGEKTTKICIEDVYKMINRLSDSIDRNYQKIEDILDSVEKELEQDDGSIITGSIIVGTGTSQPCDGDQYDEELGSRIAFMKSKLNANLKKHNLIKRILCLLKKTKTDVSWELTKVDRIIIKDLNNLRKYNPQYLKGIEEAYIYGWV